MVTLRAPFRLRVKRTKPGAAHRPGRTAQSWVRLASATRHPDHKQPRATEVAHGMAFEVEQSDKLLDPKAPAPFDLSLTGRSKSCRASLPRPASNTPGSVLEVQPAPTTPNRYNQKVMQLGDVNPTPATVPLTAPTTAAFSSTTTASRCLPRRTPKTTPRTGDQGIGAQSRLSAPQPAAATCRLVVGAHESVDVNRNTPPKSLRNQQHDPAPDYKL